MPKYKNTASPSTPPAANPAAPHANLLLAMRSQSPPTLPYAPSTDCDPVDIINMMTLPVNAIVISARGQASVDVTDKHA